MRLFVLPLSKALHAALLLSTQEEMGTCEGRFVSRGAKLRVSGCILPRELRWLSRRIWTVKGPMTREGTCQSLQSRALSLDVDSKQWLYLLNFIEKIMEIFKFSKSKMHINLSFAIFPPFSRGCWFKDLERAREKMKSDELFSLWLCVYASTKWVHQSDVTWVS